MSKQQLCRQQGLQKEREEVVQVPKLRFPLQPMGEDHGEAAVPLQKIGVHG